VGTAGAAASIAVNANAADHADLVPTSLMARTWNV
jgi:hypothetical protein